MTCSKCGRRASERIGIVRDSRGHGLLYVNRTDVCDGPLHDLADRVEEMKRAIDHALLTLEDAVDDLPNHHIQHTIVQCQNAIKHIRALQPPRAKETTDAD